MNLLSNLGLGFDVAMEPLNLAFCFLGALLGTLIGVLPGFGPVATIALLLPLTYHLPPIAALIMLAGIYYGAQYGGSTTAILVNLPGEASSVVTCLDGHQMARKGRPGAALAIAAIASFVAGTLSILVVAATAPFLASAALKFTAPEYFSLMVLGLIGIVVLARGSVLKALLMIVLGLTLGLIGLDVNTGAQRYTFGIPQLFDGVSVVALAMGLFGVAEIMFNLERPERRPSATAVGSLFPTRAEMREATPAALRGTAVGAILGVLPGGGALLSSFAAYALEKKIARDPSRFGTGAIEGLAAPEAANNAGAQTSFIPMLTLGIPPNPVMALMVGAMTLQGLTPGPQIMTNEPALFWGMIASMWIGNVMLLVINLPLIRLWIAMLRVPYRVLYPIILLTCCLGAYSIDMSVVSVMVMGAFALLGYVLLKLDFDLTPLVLGFVLGPMMEENLRRAMLVSRGDPMIFLQRPISLVMLLLAVGLLISTLAPAIRRRREEVFVE